MKQGNFVFVRNDGSQKEFSVGMTASELFRYDDIHDRYFLSLHYSNEDQRTKVFYFDRELNPVEELELPRVLLQQGYPDSFLKIPASDGFVVSCGRSDDMPNVKDFDGEPVRRYLCHVRRDQSIVRALTGAVSNLAVSPDGCRVFGFWKQYGGDQPWAGKIFSIGLCSGDKVQQGK